LKKKRGGRREMAIATVNPATGQVVKEFESLTDAELEVKLQKAVDTFSSIAKKSIALE
jgi:succinate-semialdehyde dehydrogenase / glutarate-semialdehyde dehydrogenase